MCRPLPVEWFAVHCGLSLESLGPGCPTGRPAMNYSPGSGSLHTKKRVSKQINK